MYSEHKNVHTRYMLSPPPPIIPPPLGHPSWMCCMLHNIDVGLHLAEAALLPILNLENSHHTSAVPDNYSQPGEQPSYQFSTRHLFSTWRTAIIPVQYQTIIFNLENNHHTSAVLDNYSQTWEQPSYQCSARQLFSTGRIAIIPVQYQKTILILENSHHTSAVLDNYSQPGEQPSY